MIRTRAGDLVGDSGPLLADKKVAERYGVSDRTVKRWEKDPALGFPVAVVINRRKYRRLFELEAWERTRARDVEAA